MRYIAFPSAFSRIALELENIQSQHGNWTIVIGPTENGLYILEATEEAIEVMKSLYDGFYLFMKDFDEPN